MNLQQILCRNWVVTAVDSKIYISGYFRGLETFQKWSNEFIVMSKGPRVIIGYEPS